MLTRQLSLEDYPAMRAAVASNSLFQGKAPPFTLADWERFTLRRMSDQYINLYFGAFDDADHLLAFTLFQNWWGHEENAASLLGSFASNDYPQEKVEGSEHSESHIQSIVAGFDALYDEVTLFYACGPATFEPGYSPVMPVVYQRTRPLVEEVTEIVKAGQRSTQPLMVKYLLKDTFPQDQRIMKLTKPV